MVYCNQQTRKTKSEYREHYQPFFYPLDSIGQWNRIYGSKGFYQYQFVVPFDALDGLSSILRTIIDSGFGSFLAVLKEFGSIPSPGSLSLPRPDYCLALDFPQSGAKTKALIHALDTEVRSIGGAAPAKDCLTSASSFQSFFSNWRTFSSYVDLNFSSDFWRRVSVENTKV